MNVKTFTAGILAGITYFLLNWLAFGVVFTDLFSETANGVMKSEEEMMSTMHYLVIGQVLMGLFLAYVLSKWANVNNAFEGAKAGLCVGAFASAAYDFTMLGTTNISTLSNTISDIIIASCISGLAGAVVGWWLGRK